MNSRFPIALVLAACLVSAVVVTVRMTRRPAAQPLTAPAPPSDPSLGRISPELAAELLALEAREQRVAETTWAVESMAASCGAVFEQVWDRLNRASSTSKWDVVASFPVGQIIAPVWAASLPLSHGIETRRPQGTSSPLSPATWNQRLTALRNDGWSLLQVEFRHTRFETNAAGQPARSRFAFTAHFLRPTPAERAVLEGSLDVTWAPLRTDAPDLHIERLDASQLELRRRSGEAPFQPVFAEAIPPARHSLTVDPLIAHDLDGDGLPEILLIGRNLVFRRSTDGMFRGAPISPALDAVVSAAVLGDFDGDSHPDLLCQTLRSLEFLPGIPGGSFEPAFRTAWSSPPEVRSVMTLTAGDVDRDGDLDVFLGQYKEPYEGGASPTPFHAANDGYPAFLLLNNGRGQFTDATTTAGLSTRRHRRMYSAAFVDLDVDGHLDLLTVSDFAGLDLYRNDGQGLFTDVTGIWVANPLAFGMAHSLADFNADGRLDLLMTGMTSATVDRLEHLGLRRPDSHQDQGRRRAMTHGNRLYIAQPAGGYMETTLGDSIARSGWSWGCASADFDNDGFPDVAIGNGLESRETVHDYESEYWLHDQHVGTSVESPAAYLYFKAKIARTRGRGMSYGGYDKNRLYLNQAGERFLEAGHLLGVALEHDTRNVLAEDVDADGRVDLVVTSFEKWPDPKPVLRIFRNQLTDPGHWIGFRIPNAAPGTSVTIAGAGGPQVRQYVAGDSYRSQHSSTLHFGIGKTRNLPRATISWPSGRSLTLTNLGADHYHEIQ